MIDSLKSFQDGSNGGAWPFLVRGLICQVNSDNERDLRLIFFMQQGIQYTWVSASVAQSYG